MSFTFTRDIPAASNNPSTDQPNMKTNYNSTDSILQTDHVSFNNANGGQHLQVTYSLNEAGPAVPTNGSVGVEFVNSVAGLLGTVSSLFFKNATTTQPLTNLPLVTSGTDYKLVTPWGIVLCFGLGGPVGGTSTSVTFAGGGMPNHAYTALVSQGTGGGFPGSANIGINALSTTGMGISFGHNNQSYYYLAIGS